MAKLHTDLLGMIDQVRACLRQDDPDAARRVLQACVEILDTVLGRPAAQDETEPELETDEP